MLLNCPGKPLDLSRPRIMGILNVTPDSFSDGGAFFGTAQALGHARRMIAEGADLIDVGGESTRPGAAAVGLQEELDRVIPVIETLSRECPIPLSVDTSKPEVMREAAKAGVSLINDVYALRRPGALETAAALGIPVCLMHMQGEPRNMQEDPRYGDVVTEVRAFLAERVAACQGAGMPRDLILVDPGFGFGKRLEHNLSLLKHLDRFTSLGAGVVAGISRKSMIGAILDVPPEGRLHGSVSAAVIAAMRGAAIIRVHDVHPTVEALKVCSAVQTAT